MRPFGPVHASSGGGLSDNMVNHIRYGRWTASQLYGMRSSRRLPTDSDPVDLRRIPVVVPGARTLPGIRRDKMWRRWFGFVTIGEFVGFAAPAIIGTLTRESSAWLTAVAMLVAGISEGAVLGWSQARALRPALPTLPSTDWTVATMLGAFAAWSVGVLLVVTEGLRGWSPALAVPTIGLGGAVMLLSVGAAQWVVLSTQVRGAAWWIAATAVSWAAGLAAFAAFTTPLWYPGQSKGETVVVGVTGGLLMAGVMAAVSGAFLVWILRGQTRPTARTDRTS